MSTTGKGGKSAGKSGAGKGGKSKTGGGKSMSRSSRAGLQFSVSVLAVI
jgi:hypothetical protein